ncbi:type III pantothenate kinase [Glaciecola petra]|uniref:Type III pantothenate kinase n=1 Tax=Glaciecola petra TaxID=3075602 RepID=A0ABU2ZVJ5_9ALTE|nr:type III pantothenate kinase [Aestuariibacter sp. P117]MDT0596669.1 type III pantothenate kinase [Aestuariibacter sp. P117]
MLDPHKLLIDVGNTSIKYTRLVMSTETQTNEAIRGESQRVAFGKHSTNIETFQVMHADIEELDDLIAQASACFFCSVKNDELSAHIKALCKKAQIPCEQATTKASQFGVKNVYSNEQNMGADRWMAIIAASHIGNIKGFDNVIVIDAGTAITCDFLVGHQHIGGWIAPGMQLLRDSVVNNTTRVFDDQTLPTTLMAGTDTPECVAQGALAQTMGFVAQAKQLMSDYCDDFECIVSGGDARLIAETGMSGIQVYPNIVLIGLAILASHNNIIPPLHTR